MWSYFFPSLVAVIMASLGFFVKNDALPARVSLGIVSMLISNKPHRAEYFAASGWRRTHRV